MKAATWRSLPPLLLLLVATSIPAALCQTNSQDASALQSVMSQWVNSHSSWTPSTAGDPCGSRWAGVMCTNGRVTSLRLSDMNLQGTLSSSIGQLSQLVYLDISFNIGLSGPVPTSIGNLKQLTTLILAGCRFTGGIPQELGNLQQLSFLALNSNKFTGTIPASLGLLSNLYMLDLSDNQLTGPIPVSTATTPGLDQLVRTQHFHFSKNQLSGTLAGLFNSNMTLIHILFDSNQLSGSIPAELGSVTTLQVLRLDRNMLVGAVPSNISNLVKLNELNLANNQLTGTLPDLSSMSVMNVVDLSNNAFAASVAPAWFTTLTSLTSLSLSSGSGGKLSGQVPKELFTLPQIQEVVLSNNAFNGTLDMQGRISKQLNLVNLENNNIGSASVTASYKNALMLAGNPVCVDQNLPGSFCSMQEQNVVGYTTSLSSCAKTPSCASDQSMDPANCGCAYSYNGKMLFRAPLFKDVTDNATFQQLETSLWTQLNLRAGSVYLSDIQFNTEDDLQVQVKLFPSSGLSFNVSELIRIGFNLSSMTYKPPAKFGTYLFIADPYVFLLGAAAGGKKSKIGTGVIAGVAAAGGLLVIALVFMAIFALRQKRKAKELTRRASTNVFASWVAGQKDSGGAPQLKGARFFSFDELKNCTDNFSDSHEIGAGGYGKVYKGTLLDGTQVAIKRAQPWSTQGAAEFKNEIELLSRVHHRNLVSLVGFCYEHGEQMLVYEFVSGGTLRENLTDLGWTTRLKVALGSARGLAYLHELADPPIIHRDVKSTNILLDGRLKPKVADFGLSKLVADAGKGHVSTQVKGTLGYLDPEYYMTQQLSEKSDVYSFGVVMLELATGRRPIENGKYVVREVREAIDPADHDHYGLRAVVDPAVRPGAGLRRFVQLAMRCVEESAAARPDMGTVVKEVEAMLLNEPAGSENESEGDAEITRGSSVYGGDIASDYMPYFEVKPK